VHTGAGPRAREASARGCTRARERGSAMERREGREERGTHHGLDGRQQPLTEIHPRAGRQVEDREREVTLRGKERMREWGAHGGGGKCHTRFWWQSRVHSICVPGSISTHMVTSQV
jgi:hypothetical protein